MENRLIRLDTEHFADVCGLCFRVKQVTLSIVALGFVG